MRHRSIAVVLACPLALLLAGLLAAQTSDSLDFLAGLTDFREVRNMLPAYLNRLGMALLDERGARIAQLSTSQEVAARKALLRERMLKAIGGLPERTPLNARVVGGLDRDGYRIEKVIFESQPRFYVTANLYLPKTGRPPYPGVLFPLGHERGGKANRDWQHVLVSLARRGFVGLAWDPLGQGERSQFYDADLADSKLGAFRSTTEHSMLGTQCLLVGDNLARYTIWDGIRALDYLLSRKEVDPARIAVTGNSGGGTHTAYLAALDDRLAVAAPSCYITSWRRLLETIGPQDAEQCLPPSLGDGLDHADFVHAFAPRPYLILSAIRDFFSISGARQTFEEARRSYTLMGAGEKLSMFEADDGHGYTKPRRLAAYDWLSRWLKGAEDRQPEQPVEVESEEELRSTESGQVMLSPGGETVFSLNLKRMQQARPARTPLSSAREVAAHKNELQRQVPKLTGFQLRPSPLNVKPFGQLRREGYRIEKLIYQSEPGILVPALLFISETAAPRSPESGSPAILFAHGKGKSAGREQIEQLVKAGFVVLAVDVRGTGETAVSGPQDGQAYGGFFGDYSNTTRALLVGKTLVGMRAEDLARGVELLAGRPEVDRERIYGFGVGAGALTLLHAAVLDERIKKIALEGMLASYESVATHRIHRDVYESLVPGVLKVYDLPDLVAALAPRPVWIVNATDPVGKRINIGELQKQYARPLEAFKALGAESAIRMAWRNPEEGLQPTYRELR